MKIVWVYLPENQLLFRFLGGIGSAYTTGLSSIDYFITDNVMGPKECNHLFSEKIYHLPHHAAIYEFNSTQIGDVGPLPALEKGHITFGTLTRAIRINDSVIKVWADILKRVKHSKLIINSGSFKDQILCMISL